MTTTKVLIKKRELLKAMKQILSEYKETKHTTKLNECGLCKMFYQDVIDLFPQCTSCPMNVFEGKLSPYPCKHRKCEPIDCFWESYFLGTKKIPAVIKTANSAFVAPVGSPLINDAIKTKTCPDAWNPP